MVYCRLQRGQNQTIKFLKILASKNDESLVVLKSGSFVNWLLMVAAASERYVHMKHA